MSNDDASIEEKVARLAAEATDRDPVQPPAPLATDGFFWRTLDSLGGYAAYAALVLILLAFVVGLVGGADYGWVGFLGIPALALFIFYILYLMRRRQQNRAAEYLQLQQEQERARLEIARLVLEQSQQEKPAKD
jgi:hypothetical protein